MKNILITGGAGFIGSNFLKIFVSKEKFNKIIVLDNLTYASNFSYIKDLFKLKNIIFLKEIFAMEN